MSTNLTSQLSLRATGLYIKSTKADFRLTTEFNHGKPAWIQVLLACFPSQLWTHTPAKYSQSFHRNWCWWRRPRPTCAAPRGLTYKDSLQILCSISLQKNLHKTPWDVIDRFPTSWPLKFLSEKPKLFPERTWHYAWTGIVQSEHTISLQQSMLSNYLKVKPNPGPIAHWMVTECHLIRFPHFG